MRKIEPEFITGMGYIGASPGVLYHMGGAGEQTVVTGNPALLEGVKGNRFTSLTLHGKSSQKNTTGAQLFDEKNVVDGFVNSNGILTHGDEKRKETTSDYIPIPKEIKPTSITATAFGTPTSGDYLWLGISFYGADKTFISRQSNSSGVGAKKFLLKANIPSEAEYLRLSYRRYNDVVVMLNFGENEMPYEPYTGGKPSPSPEYPQEIESVGQSGKIGVTVTGTNLLPFEVGQKGNGFEAFADGVQVDADRNADIYAVGRNDSLVESGYDEFALMTAGKYYIYSGTQDVYLYVVVWRKGKNVVLGYSVGTNAAQIEIMDGDKFRIFLRTAAAFKGKVKAMITRTPMNATSYEPYKPVQKLIVPTPNGLPGIPVSSGGNYTDEKGQQWVADEIDLANGEMVQRIGKTVVDGEKVKFVASQTSIYWNLPRRTSPGIIDGFIHISMYFADETFSGNNTYEFAWTTPGIMKPYFDTPEELNAFCVQKNSEGNPLTIYYRIETPIRTPLSPETIAAYKALHTYSPTTTVANDAGAGMSVGYRRK